MQFVSFSNNTMMVMFSLLSKPPLTVSGGHGWHQGDLVTRPEGLGKIKVDDLDYREVDWASDMEVKLMLHSIMVLLLTLSYHIGHTRAISIYST